MLYYKQKAGVHFDIVKKPILMDYTNIDDVAI